MSQDKKRQITTPHDLEHAANNTMTRRFKLGKLLVYVSYNMFDELISPNSANRQLNLLLQPNYIESLQLFNH